MSTECYERPFSDLIGGLNGPCPGASLNYSGTGSDLQGTFTINGMVFTSSVIDSLSLQFHSVSFVIPPDLVGRRRGSNHRTIHLHGSGGCILAARPGKPARRRHGATTADETNCIRLYRPLKGSASIGFLISFSALPPDVRPGLPRRTFWLEHGATPYKTVTGFLPVAQIQPLFFSSVICTSS